MPEIFPWAPAWLRDPWVLLAADHAGAVLGGRAVSPRASCATCAIAAASMSTLVSLGTSAAYVFSVAVTLWPHAFMAAGAMPYYETAAVVITLVVLGRWLEARARGRTSEAIRRLVSLAPRTARVLRDGVETDDADGEVVRGRPRPRPAGRADARGRRGRRGRLDAWTSRCSPARVCPSTRRPASPVFGGTVNRTGSVRASAPPAWAPRRRWRASSGSSRRRRARARRSSASPIAWRPSSCRWCSRSPALTFAVWWVLGPGAARCSTR